MRFINKPETIATTLGLALILAWSAGCASSPSPTTPVKAPTPVYAMVDLQKVLDQHPERAKLRRMEQSLAAAGAKAEDKSALLETGRREFDAAMKVRQNQDQAAIEKKQAQLGEQLNEERRLFIESLEAQYRPLLFNIELKMKTVQYSPAETQTLQQEKQRLETERQLKLKAKEDELAARFQKEMKDYAAERSRQSEAYAKQWMDERMAEIQKPVVSAEQEKLRQEIVELSQRMIQDARKVIATVAEKEKIELVWLKPAVRKPVKDITDLVVKELANVIK